jgi:hypothetical protein
MKLAASLSTANGKITCARCQAMSKRTRLQCGSQAVQGKRVCRFHGGRSTGAKSEAGKARQRAAVMKTGSYTKEVMEDRARSVRVLAGLEDAMLVLNITNMPRTRGRKPLSYVPLQEVEDVVKFAVDNPLHLPTASKVRPRKFFKQENGLRSE